METAASIAATLLGAIAVFQLALAFGAPWGSAAWGGQHPGVLPPSLRIASGVAGIVVYPLLIDGIVAAAGVRDRPVVWEPGATGMWVLTGFFTLGAAMNLVSRSGVERLWAPVSLGVAACCAVIAGGL